MCVCSSQSPLASDVAAWMDGLRFMSSAHGNRIAVAVCAQAHSHGVRNALNSVHERLAVVALLAMPL